MTIEIELGFGQAIFFYCFSPLLAWHFYVKTTHQASASSLESWNDFYPLQRHFKLNFSAIFGLRQLLSIARHF